MLLRFQAENIMSFKDAVEFNTFPSSKTHSHDWHKIPCGHATALRMSAIYGANGAGKSNLLKCISLLKDMATKEKLSDLSLTDDLFFKLDEEAKSSPSELAIEFFTADKIFYYHVAFTRQNIVSEELLLSQKTTDTVIFSRKDNKVEIPPEFIVSMSNKQSIEAFTDAINRIVRPDMSLLSFLGSYYPSELPIVHEAYGWLANLQIILPSMKVHELPHLLDIDTEFDRLVNTVIPELKTGITRLEVNTEVLKEDEVSPKSGIYKAIQEAKKKPGHPLVAHEKKNGKLANIVIEDGVIRLKTLVVVHTNPKGESVEMEIDQESDGTRRLLEYMPLLYSILKLESVFVVDEIERSIHPILIKTIMKKISESREAKGQIIFTTHESCLLDQSIFRPDEIWFAQKDVDQSTQVYPLSDYNIHKTANIENGYLNGRYGGIPFLSNIS